MTADFYDLAENATLSLIEDNLPLHFPNPSLQLSKADETIIDNGNPKYAITYPGAFPITPSGVGLIEVSWEIILDVFCRWHTSEAQAWTDFRGLRSDLFNLFNLTEKGRTLNRTNGVQGTSLGTEERPRYIPVNAGATDGAVSHIAQIMIVTVKFKINMT
jgi:hypothetical protein